MKILVYGSKGWIGGQFIEFMKQTDLVECVDFVLGTVRVNNIQALKKEIEDTEPTHIISFIGRTHGTIGDKKYTTIDYLEQKGKINDNVRDNLFSPISLALICKDKGIHYTY